MLNSVFKCHLYLDDSLTLVPLPDWKSGFMTGSICDIFFFYITCDIFCTVPTVVTGAYLSGPVCIIFMFIPLHIVRFKFFVYWSLPSLCTLYVYVTARQNKLHSSYAMLAVVKSRNVLLKMFKNLHTANKNNTFNFNFKNIASVYVTVAILYWLIF